MYYDEKVIDGVLCYRTHPDGEWNQLSPKAMTERIVGLQEQAARDARTIDHLRGLSTIDGCFSNWTPDSWMGIDL